MTPIRDLIALIVARVLDSEKIHKWIDLAYRRSEGARLMQNDGARFTRWNMEMAYHAGWKSARLGFCEPPLPVDPEEERLAAAFAEPEAGG